MSKSEKSNQEIIIEEVLASPMIPEQYQEMVYPFLLKMGELSSAERREVFNLIMARYCFKCGSKQACGCQYEN